MKDIFIMLGTPMVNLGIVKKMQKNGYIVYAFSKGKQAIDCDRYFNIDYTDFRTILEILSNENVINRVKIAYTSSDTGILSAKKINDFIGLSTLSIEAYENVSTKSKMVEKWNDDGILNRESYNYTEWHNAITELNKRFKVIIKPDDSSSSRGITILEKNSSSIILFNAFKVAKSFSKNNKVIVEEFSDGEEYTAEMIGDMYGNVCVYAISKKTHTIYNKTNKISNKLHYNSIPIKLQSAIAEFAIQSYKSLKLSSSFGHLELIVKHDGTMTPIEIGARSSGFIASDLVDIVSGHNYLQDIIQVQHREKITTEFISQNEKSSMYYFYDFPPGCTIYKEMNLMDFVNENITSIYNDRSQIIKNSTPNRINSDDDRHGFEILKGDKNVLTSAYIIECEQEFYRHALENS